MTKAMRTLAGLPPRVLAWALDSQGGQRWFKELSRNVHWLLALSFTGWTARISSQADIWETARWAPCVLFPTYITRAVTRLGLDLKCREVRESLRDSSRCSDGERGGPKMCQISTTAPLLINIADIYKVLVHTRPF